VSGLAVRLQRVWYDGEQVPFWLSALVPVYRALRAFHLALYRLGIRRVTRVGVPVIVIGNLTAGGSGKTPLVIALVEALRARGMRPAIVSRGYGGSQQAPTVLDDAPDPRRYGDEPCLIRRRTGAEVAIGRDRAEAAALLVKQGASVVIADDGLQNPSLARDIEICVIDGQRRFGNEHLLPAGPLREPLDRLSRVDFRVCNGAGAEPGEVAMRLMGDMAVAVAGAGISAGAVSAAAVSGGADSEASASTVSLTASLADRAAPLAGAALASVGMVPAVRGASAMDAGIGPTSRASAALSASICRACANERTNNQPISAPTSAPNASPQAPPSNPPTTIAISVSTCPPDASNVAEREGSVVVAATLAADPHRPDPRTRGAARSTASRARAARMPRRGSAPAHALGANPR